MIFPNDKLIIVPTGTIHRMEEIHKSFFKDNKLIPIELTEDEFLGLGLKKFKKNKNRKKNKKTNYKNKK